MGLFKGMKDMKDMVNAAPDLVEQAQGLQAQAAAQAAASQDLYQQSVADGSLAQAQAHQQAVANATVTEADLAPIAGVSLELFAEVSKGLAAYNYDQSKAVVVAAEKGVSADAWQQAMDGWNDRITANPAVAKQFNHYYTGR